jgi:integrase
MNIKRNIIFSLESRRKDGKPNKENLPIRMRVIYGGPRLDFATGYRIDEAKWDSDKQKVKNGCSNKLKQTASEINTDLQQYYTNIQQIFKEFEVKETIPTPEEVKSTFTKKQGGKKKESIETKTAAQKEPLFFNTFDFFVKECGVQNNWTDATYEKFAAVKNHLMAFRPELSFEELTEQTLNDYVEFFREERNLRNSTIGKQLGYLKWFLRWAVKKGYTTNVSFATFKPKLKTTQKKVIFLTWPELTQLRNYAIPQEKQYLERVRDVFLFCCFTGLRYSDVYNLRKSDIKKNHIEITTIKTADSLRIELNQFSKAIIDKYKDFPFAEDKALPVISNQKMNDYIKELAALAEINEMVRETYYKGNERIDRITPKHALLGTHAARRTFICNALALGIPPQVIMKWTGHSDYKAMKPYIDIADNIKISEMEKFNKL